MVIAMSLVNGFSNGVLAYSDYFEYWQNLHYYECIIIFIIHLLVYFRNPSFIAIPPASNASSSPTYTLLRGYIMGEGFIRKFCGGTMN